VIFRIAYLGLVAFLVLATPARAGRVVLVGIDGASWRVIDAMRAAGRLPAIDALLTRGVSAELATVDPVISPVVWTSLATGRSPEQHGVGGFLATRLTLEVPTVFDRLAAAGLRVGIFELLVTRPPPALPGGFVAPGWMRRDPSVWPPDLFARAGEQPWRFDHPRPAFSREEAIAGICEELRHKPAIFSKLLSFFAPDVAAVTFYAVDRASHRFWREAYPGDFDDGPAAARPQTQSLVHEVMIGIDAAVAHIAAALDPEDVVLIASDHGFEANPARDSGVCAASLALPSAPTSTSRPTAG
jgi:predicted AlkP superfamily phosphohydrolase/phosphomutase